MERRGSREWPDDVAVPSIGEVAKNAKSAAALLTGRRRSGSQIVHQSSLRGGARGRLDAEGGEEDADGGKVGSEAKAGVDAAEERPQDGERSMGRRGIAYSAEERWAAEAEAEAEAKLARRVRKRAGDAAPLASGGAAEEGCAAEEVVQGVRAKAAPSRGPRAPVMPALVALGSERGPVGKETLIAGGGRGSAVALEAGPRVKRRPRVVQSVLPSGDELERPVGGGRRAATVTRPDERDTMDE